MTETQMVRVSFTADNEIAELSCDDGLVPREIRMLLQRIEHDPLWLQSPADRATDSRTTVRVEKQAFTTPNGGSGDE